MALLGAQPRPQILVDIFQPGDFGPFVVEVSDPALSDDKRICTNQLPPEYNSAIYTRAARLLEHGRALGDAPTAGTAWKNTQRYQEIVRFGRALFADLFGATDAFAKYVKRSRHLQNGFHLQLRLANTASELWNVPWEYLHDGEAFLVGERGCLLNRWLRDVELDDHHFTTRTMPRPLCVLVVMSDPVDAVPLNVEQEIASIRAALGPAQRRGLMVVDFVEDSTLRNLDLALGEREYHVLHFSGRATSTGHGSCLILEDDDGRSAAAYAGDLMTIVRENKSLRLVVLNACRTGQLSDAVAVTDIATGLLTRVPAVVVMQFALHDRTGFEFARAFYGEIVMGNALEDALHSGRAAMRRQYERFMDWGAPVLYLQRSNMRLINRDSPPEPVVESVYALDTLPRPKVFVGRRDEQRRLRAVLPLLTMSAVFVWGMPGIGKSALVRRLIERPGRAGIIDDVLVIDCAAVTPRELLSRLASWLAGIFPETESVLLNPLITAELKIFEASKLVRRKRIILVLDRFDAMLTADTDGIGTLPQKQLQDFFMMLASASWSVLTIFTSRLYWNALPHLRRDSVLSLHIRELTQAETQQTFGQLEHLRGVLPEGLQRLVTSIGGHLGTLHLIDAAIARDPSRAQRVDDGFVASLLNRLERDWLGAMLAGIPAPERGLLAILSLFGSGFSSTHVCHLGRLPDIRAAEQWMMRWEMRSLIHYVRDDQYGDPWYAVATVIASLLVKDKAGDDLRTDRLRAAEAMQQGFFENAAHVRDSGGRLEVIPDDLFGTACDYLKYMLARSNVPQRELYIALALDWRQHWLGAEQYENAAAVVEVVWREMVVTFGQVAEAHALLAQSLKTAKGRDSLLVRASLASLAERNGRAELALEQFAALALAFAKIGELKHQADMISNQGRIWAERDIRQAITLETEALNVRRQYDSATGLAESYCTLARYAQALNDTNGAFSLIEQAAQHAQRSENALVKAQVALARGQLHAQLKAYREAVQFLTVAAELAHDAGELNIHAQAISDIGEVHRVHHSHEAAARAIIEAIELSEILNDQHALAQHFYRLAHAYFGMRNMADARVMAERAMDAARTYRKELIPDIQRLAQQIKKGQ